MSADTTKSTAAREPAGPKTALNLDGQRSLADELKVECEVMIKYAMASGFRPPAASIQALQILSNCQPSPVADNDCEALKQLSLAHEQLSQLVAPATPRTLLYLEYWRKDSFWRFLGPARVVGTVVGCALFFLLAFIVCTVLLQRYGWLSQPQLLASAGLGASFSALFEASAYLVNSAFDPRYKGYYWVKIVLGLTAGYILAQLLAQYISANSGSTSAKLGPATLALLGGFSGTIVYNILKRLSETVESMFLGDPKAAAAAQQSAARSQAAADVDRARIGQAAALVDIQQLLATNAKPEDIQKRITQLMSNLGIGSSPGSSPPPQDQGTQTSPPTGGAQTSPPSGGPLTSPPTAGHGGR